MYRIASTTDNGCKKRKITTIFFVILVVFCVYIFEIYLDEACDCENRLIIYTNSNKHIWWCKNQKFCLFCYSIERRKKKQKAYT